MTDPNRRSRGPRVLHLDLQAGAAGDMLLGALLDLGLDETSLSEALETVGVPAHAWHVRRVRRSGISALKLDVDVPDDGPVVQYPELARRLERSHLPGPVRRRSLSVLRRLGEAEARVHGVPLEEVHFHEVGALDTLVDVVGFAFGLHALGVEQVTATPVSVGWGTVWTAHGELPVPAPATAILLEGLPVRPGAVETELCTPTGAALLAEFVSSFGPLPPMRILASGYGAGSKEFPGRPNVLRALLGEAIQDSAAPPWASDQLYQVETNLDDAPPQLLAHLAGRLREAGCLDVWHTPVVMKKGRPGVVLSALVPKGALEAVRSTLFLESPTLGVRSWSVTRDRMERRSETVDTPWGPVQVMVGLAAGEPVKAWPEYDSCQAVANEAGVPLARVWSAALAAWERLTDRPHAEERPGPARK